MNIKPIDSKTFHKAMSTAKTVLLTVFIIVTAFAYYFAWKHLETRGNEIMRVFSADRTTYINSPIVVEAQGKAE